MVGRDFTNCPRFSEIPVPELLKSLSANYRNRCPEITETRIYTLVETCKMNDVDPQAWLADVLARLPDYPANKVADLLPWNWKVDPQRNAAVAA